MIHPGWMAFVIALEFLVAVLAFRLARSRPYHRPAALYLLAIAVAEVVRCVLALTLLRAPGPYAGALRYVYNLDQVLTLVEPIGLAGLALEVFWPARLQMRLRFYAVAAFVAAVIVVAYPQLRDAGYAWALLGVWGAAQAVAWTTMVVWRAQNPKAWPSLTQRLVPSYASAQACIQLGPVLAGSIFQHWEAGFAACVLLQLIGIVQQALWIGAPMDAVVAPPRSARGRRGPTGASGAPSVGSAASRPARLR